MDGSPRFGRADVIAALSLLGTAVVVAWPILRGGYASYVDNAVHMAEIWDLARPDQNGWSEIGFAGFPLGTLHSPLWYPALALLTRSGLPLAPLYAGAVFTGFVAPPAAIYVIARRRLGVALAASLSYLVLVQYAMIWGIGSPLGGMWTNCLAYALLLFLTELHARPVLSPLEHLGSAALLAVAVLTHLFVLPVVAILAVITIGVHHRDRVLTRDELERRAFSAAVAALASAKYWLTLFESSNEAATPIQFFHPTHLLARLFLPADPIYLLNDRLEEGIRGTLHFTECVPVLLLIGLGVWAAVSRRVERTPLGRTGFLLALSLLGILLAQEQFPMRFLGPVSWRLVDWIRLGLALSAMDALVSLERRLGGAAARRLGTALAPVGIALGFWWRVPLVHDVGPDPKAALGDIRPLWNWLREHKKPEWGRVYLQDTFGWDWSDGGLPQTHALVLTAHETGVRQLGTYYGIVPYGLRWTLSEFNSLYTTQEPSEEWVNEAMEKTNAGILVTSSWDVADRVLGWDSFTRLFQAGVFSVFRRNGATDHPIAELSPANHLANVDFRTGDVRFELTTEYDRSRVLLRTLWHPWWRISGPPGAWLRESPEGFLAIDDIPKGTHRFRVWYEPNRLPSRLSAVGWAALSLWAFFLGRVKSRREPTPS